MTSSGSRDRGHSVSRAAQRDVMGYGLVALNWLAGSSLLDRLGIRKHAEDVAYQASKSGFRTAGAARRGFKAVQGLTAPARLPSSRPSDLFDLTLDDEQQMIVDTVAAFAAEKLRPAAAEANESCAPPPGLMERVSELGVTLVGVPEDLGGAGTERSAVTNVLVAEALAHGDMGLAVSCLAPSAVSTALVLWGDEVQQATYLPSFVGESVPVAALTLLEPHPLFDPFALRTTARRTADGFVLSGVKSLVPRAADAELFVIAADLEGSGPALFLVESSSTGLSIESEPAMGLRAASMGRVLLKDVQVPAAALLGDGRPGVYRECVRLGRLGWCALALGTGKAVLDYVIPYVNEREAFGEPISNRQAVAFKVSDMATELEGMRLLTYRAASRAEQGKDFARDTALARRLCAEQGMTIGTDGVQLLGGHGFVKEHPVERWYRDLRAIGVMEGVLLV
ncbi:MAG: acyl-CoA dehydrogenase family protein [Mycobacteriaceae bacterium]